MPSFVSSLYRSVASSEEEDQNVDTQKANNDNDVESKKKTGSAFQSEQNDSNSRERLINESSLLQKQQQRDTASQEEEQWQKEQDEEGQSSSNGLRLPRARWLLYMSHLFSQFAEGAWQFAVILFLAAITKNRSIVLVSTYMLTTYAAGCAFGAPLGRFVDRTNRLVAARACIFVQNTSVVIASLACCWLLTKETNKPDDSVNATDEYDDGIPRDTLSIVLLVAIHVFGSIAQALDQAFVVAIERDWVVVMSQQHQDDHAAESWLSSTNVAMRQIDLTCKVLAPAVAGIVIGQATTMGAKEDTDDDKHHWCDLHGAAVLVGCMNIAGLLVEYACTAKIYQLIPALAADRNEKTTKLTSKPVPAEIPDADPDDDDFLDEIPDDHNEQRPESLFGGAGSLWRGLVVFSEQKVVWAGWSLAVIYLNAMSFGGIMTAYLLWKGMSVEEVGLWRSIASITGLMGTFAFQLSTKFTSVVNTGELSAIYLFGCLSLAVTSFFIQDNDRLSTYLLVISCAASRTGLWTFDITTTLLYQEFVPDGVRGIVGGTQQAVNSFFVVLTSGLGLIFRRPEEFYVFAVASYTGICLCLVMYTLGVYRHRDRFQLAADQRS